MSSDTNTFPIIFLRALRRNIRGRDVVSSFKLDWKLRSGGGRGSGSRERIWVEVVDRDLRLVAREKNIKNSIYVRRTSSSSTAIHLE